MSLLLWFENIWLENVLLYFFKGRLEREQWGFKIYT